MTNPSQPNFQLTELSIEQVNTMLEALSQLPFFRVAALIDKLQREIQSQLPTPANEDASVGCGHGD